MWGLSGTTQPTQDNTAPHYSIPYSRSYFPTPHHYHYASLPPYTTSHRITSHNISSHLSPYPFHSITSLYISLTIPPSPLIPSHPIPLGLLNYMFHNIQMRQSELDRYLCYQKRLLRRLKRIEEEKKVVYLIKLTMPDYLFLMGMIDYDSTDQVSFVISLRVKLYNIILYRMNVSPSHTNLF